MDGGTAVPGPCSGTNGTAGCPPRWRRRPDELATKGSPAAAHGSLSLARAPPSHTFGWSVAARRHGGLPVQLLQLAAAAARPAEQQRRHARAADCGRCAARPAWWGGAQWRARARRAGHRPLHLTCCPCPSLLARSAAAAQRGSSGLRGGGQAELAEAAAHGRDGAQGGCQWNARACRPAQWRQSTAARRRRSLPPGPAGSLAAAAPCPCAQARMYNKARKSEVATRMKKVRCGGSGSRRAQEEGGM